MHAWLAMTRDSAVMRSLMLCGVLLGIGFFTGCGGKPEVTPVTPQAATGPKAII